uniref:Tenascin-R n=1 Tax=Magallana gigas TaxID=29159 RepID=K1QAW9_MAGGI
MGFSSTKVALVTSTERDCECIGTTTSLSGVYEITVNGQLTSVFCEMKYGFQWTVVFRRTVGNVLFNNVWTSYTNGFGNLDGDFWLGLDNIHHFTSSGQSVMRVEMEDINGQTGFAQYSTFLVGSPSSNYKLIVSQYAGNSGCKFFFNFMSRGD